MSSTTDDTFTTDLWTESLVTGSQSFDVIQAEKLDSLQYLMEKAKEDEVTAIRMKNRRATVPGVLSVVSSILIIADFYESN